MTTAPAVLASLAVLGAAGTLPALALAGLRPVALFLAPLTGAVLAAAAATVTLVVPGPLLAWFVLAAGAASVAVVVVWVRAPRWRPRPFDGSWRLQVVGGATVAAAGALVLLAVRSPSVGFDARSIWMLHAVWYADGHGTALAALRSRALPFAHPSYPPLVGGTVAISFLVAGTHAYRVGVVVVAVLNLCALGAAALALVEVGRRLSATLAAAAGSTHRPSLARWCRVPSAAGAVAAGLLVMTAAGVAGPFATNGYADLLWAAAATGAVGFALVLPRGRAELGAACVLVAVAGLTKQEGYATAMAIVVLVAARSWWAARVGRPPARRRVLVAAVAALAALSAWPLLTTLLGAAPNVSVAGRRQGTDATRARATLGAMDAHLHVLWVAVPVAVVAGLVLSGLRRRAGLSNDLWAWGALAAGGAMVASTYVTGPGNVQFWLLTSAHRTTMFPALVAWWILATWGVCGAAAIAARPVLGRRLLRPGPLVPAGRPAGGASTPPP